MSKFSTAPVKARTSPISVFGTDSSQPSTTFEGAAGFKRNEKSQLFFLAGGGFSHEDTYYETADEREARLTTLVRSITESDPAWIRGFIGYLRNTLNIRSAAVAVACEYVAAGGPFGRQAIASAISRGDEPGEVLGYWKSRHGASIPKPVKRGISDAMQRIMNERTALRYDGQGKAWRLGDVIETVHPKPINETQSKLYGWLLDRRHRKASAPEGLEVVQAYQDLQEVPLPLRRTYLNSELMSRAGMNWEMASGWIQSELDAQVWEALIPSMGYFALTRNLRNFEDKGVSESVLHGIAMRLQDPEQVRKSKLFPYHFYSAYKFSGTSYFTPALEKALELSTSNVPSFSGRTLILQDTSGSMGAVMSEKSKITAREVSAVFGTTLAQKSAAYDYYLFGTSYERLSVKNSILRTLDEVESRQGHVGHGTEVFPTIQATYRPNQHDRIVIFTDGQYFPSNYDTSLVTCPIYQFVINGYETSAFETGEKGRFDFSSLTDSSFILMNQIEHMQSVNKWPWE